MQVLPCHHAQGAEPVVGAAEILFGEGIRKDVPISEHEPAVFPLHCQRLRTDEYSKLIPSCMLWTATATRGED